MCCGSGIKTAGRRVSTARKSSKPVTNKTAKVTAVKKSSDFQEYLSTLEHPQPQGAYYNNKKEDVSKK